MAPIRNNTATVQYNFDKGPIYIEVTSGYSTLGNFRLSYVKKGEYSFIEFGTEPKRIDDYIPDIFQIPPGLDELHDYIVVILGKYAPAPGNQQIYVTYQFIQESEPLPVKPADGTIIKEASGGEFFRYTNYFNFEKL